MQLPLKLPKFDDSLCRYIIGCPMVSSAISGLTAKNRRERSEGDFLPERLCLHEEYKRQHASRMAIGHLTDICKCFECI